MKEFFLNPNLPLPELVNKTLLKPFPALRYGAYNCADGLVSHEWGFQSLMSQNAFFELILTRNPEEAKEEKEWRYTVIQTMLKTANQFPNLLTGAQKSQCEKYLKQGIFFVDAQNTMEIAT